MLYDYQYSIVAIITTVFLILVTHQRRGYPTPRNRLFIHLLYCNLFLTLSDIFTFCTISFPERYSILVLYLSNIVYIILFSIMTCSFFCYVAALAEGSPYYRLSRIIFYILIAIDSVLALSTYWTHWIIYFDDDLVYQHGPLFVIMYIFPIFMLLVSVVGFYHSQARFSNMHKSLVAGLSIFGTFIAAMQILIPQFDSITLAFSLILFLLYMIYENPSYYTFHNTRCFNEQALYKACEELKEKGENPEIVLVGIFNHSRNHGIQEMMTLNFLMDAIANELFQFFHHQVFSIGGGKFLIIVNGTPLKSVRDVKTAEEVLARLDNIFHQPIQIGDTPIPISYRTRLFHFMDLAISDDFIDHLIEGFQQTSLDRLFFVDNLTLIIKEQHEYREIEDVLSYAVKEDKFKVFFQPIYHIKTGKFKSAEALMRLSDEAGRSIPPDLLVSIAEKNGNIVEIGELIFEKVCRFWKENNLSALGMEYVEVNMSPVQLEQKDMAARLIDIMEKYQLSPSCINLEILETAFQTSNQYVGKNISILKKYGFHFSIDDFGSGFASTDYLFRFPISLVKIDKSILWQAMKNEDGAKVFRSTLDLVNELDKGIVVEGAESEEMVDVIREAGAQYIQGFYFSKPIPGEEFISFLAKKNQ